MPHVDTPSAHVFYTVEGKKAGDGPAVVLIHGTGGSGEANWRPVADRLRESATLILPDYAGSGTTEDDGGPLTLEGIADQIAAVLDAAGAGPVLAVGFSLGAPIAVTLATRHPEAVSGLVLLAGFLRADDSRMTLQFDLWRALARIDPALVVRHSLLTGFVPDTVAALDDKEIEEAVRLSVDGLRIEGFLRQIDLDQRVDITNLAPKVAVPTLVVGCTGDQMVPIAHARALHALIPGAEYREIATGHLAPLEAPDTVADLVRERLSKE